MTTFDHSYVMSWKSFSAVFNGKPTLLIRVQYELNCDSKKWSFDGKLCREYLYQKLSKSDNWFLSYSQKCRDVFFETQCRCLYDIW